MILINTVIKLMVYTFVAAFCMLWVTCACCLIALWNWPKAKKIWPREMDVILDFWHEHVSL